MSNVIIGSARIDEYGNAVGGKSGDQKQTTIPDYKGEVSMEQFYVHAKGWNVLRAKDTNIANKIAKAMETACNNPCIGYDQGNRLGIISRGVNTTENTECDCSSLVRQCIKEATGIDVGNFTTYNECATILKSNLFDKFAYTNSTVLYTGDILVTKSKGHTAIVVSGNNAPIGSSAPDNTYYPRYTGSINDNLDTMLRFVGVPEVYIGNVSKRTPLANANYVFNYVGSYEQNYHLKALVCCGYLKRI